MKIERVSSAGTGRLGQHMHVFVDLYLVVYIFFFVAAKKGKKEKEKKKSLRFFAFSTQISSNIWS